MELVPNKVCMIFFKLKIYVSYFLNKLYTVIKYNKFLKKFFPRSAIYDMA